MPRMPRTFVVVGGGIAGTVAVETLQRHCCPTDKVILVSASAILKGIGKVVRLTGHANELEVVTRDLHALAGPNTSVIQAAAVRLDVAGHELHLSTGQVIEYDRICIASGASPKVIDSHPSVYCVRDLESVEVLAGHLSTARHVIIVGNGAIALELVGAVKGQCQVTWVVKHQHIGDALFDADAAGFLLEELERQAGLQLHHVAQQGEGAQRQSARPSSQAAQDRGGGGGGGPAAAAGTVPVPSHAAGPQWTRLLPQPTAVPHRPTSLPWLSLERSATVARITTPSAGAHAHGSQGTSQDGTPSWPVYVELTNGACFGADAVVSAIGVSPNTAWLQHGIQAAEQAATSGLHIALAEDGGILVDRRLQATSVPDGSVFAAGDCCTIREVDLAPHFHQMRLWTQARLTGAHAAHCMLGCEDEYGSDMPLALFTHVTQFLGLPVILLGLYNGQRLQEEPREDVLLLSRAHHGCQAQREPGAGNTAHGRSDSVGGSGQSCSFVRVLLLRGRVQGAVLIGEATEMAGGFEDLILDQLDVSHLGPALLDPDLDLEHMFD